MHPDHKQDHHDKIPLRHGTVPLEVRTPPFDENWAFFLDIDGTLCEFKAVPAQVKPSPQTLALLKALAERTDGAVALISGRSLDNVVRMFSPLDLPAAGQHGAEYRDAQQRLFAARSVTSHTASLEAAAAQLAEFVSGHKGLLLENKGLTLALHYRGAPYLAKLSHAAMRAAAMRLGAAYEVQQGKMVWELKPAGSNKGAAIERFMREPPFAARTPVFIGDDVTDESGFITVNRMGGHSVKVGSGGSQARWRLKNPAEVAAWLNLYIAHGRPGEDPLGNSYTYAA